MPGAAFPFYCYLFLRNSLERRQKITHLFFQGPAQLPRAVEFTLTSQFFNLPGGLKDARVAEVPRGAFKRVSSVRQSGGSNLLEKFLLEFSLISDRR
jgi:hypothetical protein